MVEPIPTPAPGNEPAPPTPPVEPTPPIEPTPPEPPEKFFTQKDLDDAIAAAVEKAKKGWDKERTEADRLAKLSEDERAKEQLRLDREKYETERAALDRELLVNEAAKQLRAAGVSDSFAKLVCGKDAEETKTNIDVFTKEWNAAIEAAVNERLKGNPPRTGGGTPTVSSMADIIKNSITHGF